MHRLDLGRMRCMVVSVILVLGLVLPDPAGAQTTPPALSGTVKSSSGTAVANAMVAINNVATG